MKKAFQILFVALIATFVFSSCGTTKAIVAPPAGPPVAAFTGAWTLINVAFSSLAETDVPLAFEQAPPKDFVNSTWQLDANGNGSYALANGTTQNIYWSVNSGDALGALFQFKKLNPGQSIKDVHKGYQMVISNADQATSMILKTLVYIGNKNGYVIYTFVKK